jgi:hypothetical protein
LLDSRYWTWYGEKYWRCEEISLFCLKKNMVFWILTLSIIFLFTTFWVFIWLEGWLEQGHHGQLWSRTGRVWSGQQIYTWKAVINTVAGFKAPFLQVWPQKVHLICNLTWM